MSDPTTNIIFEKDQFERMLRAMRLDKPQLKKILEAARPDDGHQEKMLEALQKLATAAEKLGETPETPQSEYEERDMALINALGLDPTNQPINLLSSFPA